MKKYYKHHDSEDCNDPILRTESTYQEYKDLMNFFISFSQELIEMEQGKTMDIVWHNLPQHNQPGLCLFQKDQGNYAMFFLPRELFNRISRSILAMIAAVSTNITELTVSGFDGELAVEDVFTAFAADRHSSWRTKILKVLRVKGSNMNARGDSFHLPENEYSEGLSEVDTTDSTSEIVSATIFRVASRSRLLHHLLRNQCGGTTLTPGAIEPRAISCPTKGICPKIPVFHGNVLESYPMKTFCD